MKDVIITVLGGVVEVENVPKGVNVIVRDYDIESFRDDDHRIKDDDYGRYIERFFVNEKV